MMYYLVSHATTPGLIPILSMFRVRSLTQKVGAGVWMRQNFLIRETPTTSAEIPPGGAMPLTTPVGPEVGRAVGGKG